MGKIWKFLLLIFLSVSSSGIFAAGSAEIMKASTEGEAMESMILKIYTGMADLRVIRFDELEDSTGDTETRGREPLVIRARPEYEAFIESYIPKYKMMPQNPAPESDDPLLKKPAVDFSKHMMLVIFSWEPNRFIDLKITGLSLREGALYVKTEYEEPDPNEIVQKIVNYGRYFAAVVPAHEGPVIFMRE